MIRRVTCEHVLCTLLSLAKPCLSQPEHAVLQLQAQLCLHGDAPLQLVDLPLVTSSVLLCTCQSHPPLLSHVPVVYVVNRDHHCRDTCVDECTVHQVESR
jgi:hypothetical protein